MGKCRSLPPTLPRQPLRSLAILLLCALALGLLPASAQEDLMLGALSIEVEPGYSGYALPIANAALARRWTAPRLPGDVNDWSASSLMAFQVAYDYSAIPVVVRILHRQPMALAGRIEVLSAHGQHSSENDGGRFARVSEHFIAPPSVETSVGVTVRSAPPSRAGQPVRLQLRLFRDGALKPYLTRDISMIQLEAAHLYSLVLDKRLSTDDIRRLNPSRLNHGNPRQLELALDGAEADPSCFESRHYLLQCDPLSVITQPLLARQFVFIAADLHTVSSWPVEWQEAVLTFCLGGGHLMLYNCPASAGWQGLDLSASSPLGRGWLLTDPHDLSSALSAMNRWLEGELEEFVMLAGGRAAGHELSSNSFNSFRKSGLYLDELLAIPEQDAGTQALPLSHRPGYLHPVWIRREAALQASLEPWDYPEFKDYPGAVLESNANLSTIALNDSTPQPPPALGVLTAGTRTLPSWWSVLLLCSGLLWLASSLVTTGPWRAWIGRALLAWCFCSALFTLATLPTAALRKTTLDLIDMDSRLNLSCVRSVTALLAPASGDLSTALPENSLIRRVDWQGDWGWSIAQGPSHPNSHGHNAELMWLGKSTSPFTTLRYDWSMSATPPPPLRVSVVSRKSDSLDLAIDPGGLPTGRLVLLQSSLGWICLESSAQRQFIHLRLPPLPDSPGRERLEALEELVQRRGVQFGGAGSPQTIEALRLLGQLLRSRLPGSSEQSAQLDELSRLGWAALLQDPMLGRGMPHNQITVFCEQEASRANQRSWYRLCIALPDAGTEQ